MTRDDLPALPWRLARRAERLEPSVIREILKVTERPGLLSVAGGLQVLAAQVLIASGSRQGLDLVGKVPIDAGSRMAVESPTCLGVLQAFTPYEPEFQALDCDGQAPLPQALAAAAGARFLHLLPNFQNPSGGSMGAERRQAVAALGGVLRAALELRP